MVASDRCRRLVRSWRASRTVPHFAVPPFLLHPFLLQIVVQVGSVRSARFDRRRFEARIRALKEKLPAVGKISQQVFEELIFPLLGARSPSVLVGPMHGVDTGIIRVGNRALAITTDPVFIVPEYGWKRAAWFAIHILLSDVVTSGLAPRYLAIDFNLPMDITEDQLEIVWKTIHSECRRYGVAVVTGHTARYGNCGYPMVGGATVIAEGGLGDYVAPRFARPPRRTTCPMFSAFWGGPRTWPVSSMPN